MVLLHVYDHKGTFETVHIPNATGHEFTTRLGNVFTIGKGTKPWVSLSKGKGIKLTIIEEARKRLGAQTENKILDKMHRQKVAEVEKLTQTVRELEEAVLAGGAATNVVRDYQRKVQEMNVMTVTFGIFSSTKQLEEKKTLEREVACVKVTVNHVATVVANEWKDANDKVMPVKQWLEERKNFQACYPFNASLSCSSKKNTKSNSRFWRKGLEVKTSNGNSRIALEGRTISNGSSRRQSLGGAENFSKSSSNGYLSKRTSNSQYGLLRSNNASTLLKHGNISTRSFDGGSRSLDRDKLIPDASGKDNVPTNTCD
ncbi:microtubule-associated protein 70-2 [Quercus suber]|uniref:Microtubule-associated protein 70-2 n=1 Tax=Quercus suber TaxID=58331 RepID=A0AAW0JXY6_QUESU